MENSRPDSCGRDDLFEVTLGRVAVEDRSLFEMGIDYEYFLPQYDHHFSIGLASEIEFQKEDEYFVGPLMSIYYFHTKLFYTSGIQTNFQGTSFWKNRLGLGFEYFVDDHFIIVPTVAIDRAEGEYHHAQGIGFAIEF